MVQPMEKKWHKIDIVARLAQYKWLDGGIDLVEGILRSPCGKGMKVKLGTMTKGMAKYILLGGEQNTKVVNFDVSDNGHRIMSECLDEKTSNGIQRERIEANGDMPTGRNVSSALPLVRTLFLERLQHLKGTKNPWLANYSVCIASIYQHP